MCGWNIVFHLYSISFHWKCAVVFDSWCQSTNATHWSMRGIFQLTLEMYNSTKLISHKMCRTQKILQLKFRRSTRNELYIYQRRCVDKWSPPRANLNRGDEGDFISIEIPLNRGLNSSFCNTNNLKKSPCLIALLNQFNILYLASFLFCVCVLTLSARHANQKLERQDEP